MDQIFAPKSFVVPPSIVFHRASNVVQHAEVNSFFIQYMKHTNTWNGN